jgi:hypothetical protein
MENNITQKEFDCDHNCTYDSDRKMKEVTVNADGTKTVKTGYRKCVDECLTDDGS